MCCIFAALLAGAACCCGHSHGHGRGRCRGRGDERGEFPPTNIYRF